ncbi:MAG: hypothetical protein AB8G96_10110 [Phycisphaerales bacterium]
MFAAGAIGAACLAAGCTAGRTAASPASRTASDPTAPMPASRVRADRASANTPAPTAVPARTLAPAPATAATAAASSRIPVRLDPDELATTTAGLAVTRLSDPARFPGIASPAERLLDISSESPWSLAGRVTVHQSDVGRRLRSRGPLEAGVAYQLTLEAWRPDEPNTVLVREVGTGRATWIEPADPSRMSDAERIALRDQPFRAFDDAIADLVNRLGTRRGELLDHVRAWAPEYPASRTDAHADAP